MKLQEAIKILEDYKMQSAFDATPAFTDALKLGIEALQRHQTLKSHPYFKGLQLLPGETEGVNHAT